jgi:hypothetical protein
MKVLILVHGMGVNDSQWSKGIVDKLDALSAGYEKFKTTPFSKDSDLLIEEITYDFCFTDLGWRST